MTLAPHIKKAHTHPIHTPRNGTHQESTHAHTRTHTHPPYTHLREMHEGSGTHITYITHHSGDRRGPCPVPLQVACACSHWPGRPLPSNLAQAARSPAPLPLRGFFFSTMLAGCSCMARPGGGEGCGVGAQQARRLGMTTPPPSTASAFKFKLACALPGWMNSPCVSRRCPVHR